MTTERIPAPGDWVESELPRDDVRAEQGQRPTIFEHARQDVAVHVAPDGPDTGASRGWSVGLVFGDGEDVRDRAPLRDGLDDRASAIECAKAVMVALDREGVPASPADVDPDALLAGE